LLAHIDKVRDQAQQRSRGQVGTLSVGFTSAAMWSGVLPKVLRRFRSEFPNATVELQNMRSATQLEALRAARIDIGFISTSATSSDLETRCISQETSMLVIPDTHPLAKKRRIGPVELHGIRWILLSDSFSPEKHDRFLAACASAGFMPQVVQRVSEPFTLLALVEGGMGVGLIRSSARNYAPRSLIFRILPWFSFKSRTYMVRPTSGRQPLADTFAAYMPAVDDRSSSDLIDTRSYG
jgi:DNA-binding transcriptional LysR family regulator